MMQGAKTDREVARCMRLLAAIFPDYAGYRKRVRKLIPFVY